ncbi:MAG: hypothetical protein JJE30_15490 [Desulfuromonadales bacterium]|nr:hypothetical protein [Desulfuromonadales bacterium]
MYGFASQTYSIDLIGPSISAFYIISFIFLLDEIRIFVTKGIKFSSRTVALLIVPLFSVIIVSTVFIFNNSFFEFKSNQIGIIIKPFFFYLKQYLPLFAIASKIYREAPKFSINHFYDTLKKTAIFSCYIAIAQYFIHYSIGNQFIDQLIGLKNRYIFQFHGIDFVRIQAFCTEPKNFSALLALSIPLLLRNGRYIYALIASILAIMTLGQTFPTMLLIAVLTMLIFARLSTVRLNLISSLVTFIIFFQILFSFSTLFIDSFLGKNGSIIQNILFDRAVNRFTDSDDTTIKNLFGIPLQRDLEAPVINYLVDHPWMFLTGYGPANSAYIPSKYWIGEWNYALRSENNVPNHMNMRWLFYIAEFGIIVFMVIWMCLTGIKAKKFERNFYSFILLCLFIIEIEVVAIIMFALLCAERQARSVPLKKYKRVADAI